MNKDVRKLVRALERIDGIEITHGGSHLAVRRHGDLIVTLPTSPSDHRWRANTLRELRRAGITPGVRPEKLSRPPKTIAIVELRPQLRAIVERRQGAEFARFMQQLAEVRGLRCYGSVSAASVALGLFASGKTNKPREWAWRLLSEALIEWQRTRQQPLPSLPEIEETDERSDRVRVVIDVSRLVSALAEFGVSIEFKKEEA